jgi:hypothetical protein
MMKDSAQLTTEYLILLILFIVVAFLLVTAFSEYLDMGRTASRGKSVSYWRTKPLALITWVVREDGYARFVVKNNEGGAVNLTSFRVDGAEFITEPVYLPFGGKAEVGGFVGNGTGQYSLKVEYEYENV